MLLQAIENGIGYKIKVDKSGDVWVKDFCRPKYELAVETFPLDVVEGMRLAWVIDSLNKKKL